MTRHTPFLNCHDFIIRMILTFIGVIVDCDVWHRDIADNDLFIILASDGVFCVFNVLVVCVFFVFCVLCFVFCVVYFCVRVRRV